MSLIKPRIDRKLEELHRARGVPPMPSTNGRLKQKAYEALKAAGISAGDAFDACDNAPDHVLSAMLQTYGPPGPYGYPASGGPSPTQGMTGPVGSPGPSIIPPAPYKASQMERTRFRSFAERYVVERARTYVGDAPMEASWHATLDAKKLYKHIHNVAESLTTEDLP